MNNEGTADAEWFTSSRTTANNSCVEVAFLEGGTVGLRDSKDNGKGPVLIFTPAEWDAFLGGVQDGEFDRP